LNDDVVVVAVVVVVTGWGVVGNPEATAREP
jgi:hypothetical protein